MSKLQVTAAFKETLDTLNDEQRQAVEGIQGPWIVLAGPGTGKTHMLAARIGNILMKEQVEPRNILCLTFTNAGVKAMRDRLVKFIGSAGSRVEVSTFHSFASKVIEDNPHLFDYMDWELADDLDKRRLINAVIDQLPPKHILRGPHHEPYSFGKDLLWLFGLMQQERWTPATVIEAAERRIEEAPHIFVYKKKYKEFAAGDPKPHEVEKETERMTKLIAGAKLFEDYTAEKRKRSLYDYGDQLAWLFEKLDTSEMLRIQLQEQYQYILVDEYQDTNGLQNDILTLLAEDENPNLFVVGDDDQSIYEFQGARVESLRELVDRYRSHISVAVLRQNYRSHQAILDAAEDVISENKSRLTEIAGNPLNKHLTEASRFAERPLPAIVNYPTSLAQAYGVAQQIKTWLDAGTPADEIGVIYRKHSQSARLIDMLERLDIPYRLQRSINVLELPLIRRLHLALHFIANLRSDRPVDNQQAFEFLLVPAIGISPIELFEVNNYRFTDSQRVQSWRLLLSRPELLEGENVPISNPQRYKDAAALLNELGNLVERLPLPKVIQQVAQRTGLLREAIAGDEKALNLEALDQLVRDAQSRIRKEPGLTLEGLCNTWDELNAYDMPLSLVKQADTRAAVSLMTAHSAKGLEFDRVIMYDVTRRAWDSKRGIPHKFSLPPELSHQTDFDAEESNRRLFYVALTRARKEVIMSVPLENESGRPESKSDSAELMLTNRLAKERDAEIDDEELLGGIEDLFEQELPPPAPPLDPASAKTRWEDLDLTLGAATQFNRCKVGFYYQYVSEVPRTKRSIDRFRGALHKTLQEYYRQALNPEQLRFGSLEELLALWSYQIGRERAGLLDDEFVQYEEEGEVTLRNWYNSEADPLSLNVKIERSIAVTTGNDLPLKGRIDRIDIDPQTTLGIPVDYKFGEPREIKFSLDKKTGRNRNIDNRDWRQLAFYAILIRDGMQRGSLPSKGKLIYLSPKSTAVVEVPLDPEDVKVFEEELYETFHAILKADDFSGCHEDPDTSDHDKMNCAWCAFHYLKRNAGDLVTEEVEALDD